MSQPRILCAQLYSTPQAEILPGALPTGAYRHRGAAKTDV
jgi:hypothetical protein